VVVGANMFPHRKLFLSSNLSQKQIEESLFTVLFVLLMRTATMLFANPPDSSVLASLVLLPGEEQEIKIKRPDKVDIGLYCFFTEPGDPWKIKLDQPLGEEYAVALGENNILEAEKEPGSWWCFNDRAATLC
jgi:hypothetical protein